MTPLIGVTCGARRLDGKELTYAYRNYLQAVTAAGGLPLLLGPDTPPTFAPEAMARLDGLLLTGGEDVDPSSYGRARREVCGPSDPLRDAFEIAALQACRVLGKPVLGICRGMQLMTVAMGGTLYQNLPTEKLSAVEHDSGQDWTAYAPHTVMVAPGSRLHGIVKADGLKVNSFHHQAAETLAGPLRACAWAPDGVIEAVETPHGVLCLGVQWHPERLYLSDAKAKALFEALVQASRI